MTVRMLLIAVIFITAARAEGEGRRAFSPVAAGKVFEFPRDHGSHPEFELEWWYVTGYLEDGKGETVGFQFTFFRRGMPDAGLAGTRSSWALDEVYLAHFALSRKGRGLEHDSRTSRPGPSRAAEGDLDVALEDWTLRRVDEAILLKAASDAGVIDLTLRSRKPPVVHGTDGRYLKGADGKLSSHYVSLTRLEVAGSLEIDGAARPVTGGAWFDHEFFTLTDESIGVGWDWMGLHLDDGSELMLYRFHPTVEVGGADPTGGPGGGTLVDAAGIPHPIAYGEATFEPVRSWKSTRSGGVYPVGLRVRVPSRDLTLELAPHQDDQELHATVGLDVTYWEGLVTGRGEAGGKPLGARGYHELTGYSGRGPFSRGR